MTKKEKTVRVDYRLPADLEMRLRLLAAVRRTTKTKVVVAALEAYLTAVEQAQAGLGPGNARWESVYHAEHDASLVSLVPGEMPLSGEDVVYAGAELYGDGGLVLAQATRADDREPLDALLHRLAGVLGYAVVPLASTVGGDA